MSVKSKSAYLRERPEGFTHLRTARRCPLCGNMTTLMGPTCCLECHSEKVKQQARVEARVAGAQR